MSKDPNKHDISYLPRSWGPSPKSRDKLSKEDSGLDPSEQIQSVEIQAELPEQVIDVGATEEPVTQDDHDGTPEPHVPQPRRSARPARHNKRDRSIVEENIEQAFDLEDIHPTETAGTDFVEDAPGGSDSSERIAVKVCGIRFGYASKIYHFESGAMEVDYGEWVVVKTEKGLGLGQVALPPFEKHIHVSQLEGLRKIIRKGGKVDLYQKERCREREAEARAYCLDRIEELGLPMKLVAVECFFDGSKYVFYFTSEGRVDFRELVKQLVARFPVRIEMRQIGVRHEAKMTGGLAGCGQELCCSRFLTDFRPVSVKMAKNQNLSLNPTKISGVCGRLMCCLGYEHETYEEFSRGLPKVGKMVKTKGGDGLVIKHNPLEETIVVKIDEETQIEVKREDIVSEFEAPATKKEEQPQNEKTGRKASPKNVTDQVTEEDRTDD